MVKDGETPLSRRTDEWSLLVNVPAFTRRPRTQEAAAAIESGRTKKSFRRASGIFKSKRASEIKAEREYT